MRPIELGNITTIDTETWLNWREHGPHYEDPKHPDYIKVTVTGSQAPIVMGTSRYMSNLELAYKKNGHFATACRETSSKDEIFAGGHLFEPFVALQFVRWMKKHYPNKKVVLEKNIFWEFFNSVTELFPEYKAITHVFHKIGKALSAAYEYDPDVMYQCGAKNEDGTLKYPWMIVDNDAFVTIDGKRYILECKITSDKEIRSCVQKDICPPEYDPQCRHAMATMDMDGCFLVVCWGMDLSSMGVVFIPRDEIAEQELIETERKFIEDVVKNEDPELVNQDPALLNKYLLRLYGRIPTSDGKPFMLPEKNRRFVLDALKIEQEYKQAAEHLEDLKQKKEQILSTIYPSLKGADCCSFQLSETQWVNMKLKISMKREKFNEELFKKEQPALYSEYQKSVFDEKALELEKPGLRNKYMIPSFPNPDTPPTYEMEVREKRKKL